MENFLASDSTVNESNFYVHQLESYRVTAPNTMCGTCEGLRYSHSHSYSHRFFLVNFFTTVRLALSIERI